MPLTRREFIKTMGEALALSLLPISLYSSQYYEYKKAKENFLKTKTMTDKQKKEYLHNIEEEITKNHEFGNQLLEFNKNVEEIYNVTTAISYDSSPFSRGNMDKIDESNYVLIYTPNIDTYMYFMYYGSPYIIPTKVHEYTHVVNRGAFPFPVLFNEMNKKVKETGRIKLKRKHLEIISIFTEINDVDEVERIYKTLKMKWKNYNELTKYIDFIYDSWLSLSEINAEIVSVPFTNIDITPEGIFNKIKRTLYWIG